ncbi:MAG: hypothetical protein HY921_01860 [Elusimicrobia bacterium]|nr:hypothetical protein [Elusimicrobiota bacterium]
MLSLLRLAVYAGAAYFLSLYPVPVPVLAAGALGLLLAMKFIDAGTSLIKLAIELAAALALAFYLLSSRH